MNHFQKQYCPPPLPQIPPTCSWPKLDFSFFICFVWQTILNEALGSLIPLCSGIILGPLGIIHMQSQGRIWVGSKCTSAVIPFWCLAQVFDFNGVLSICTTSSNPAFSVSAEVSKYPLSNSILLVMHDSAQPKLQIHTYIMVPQRQWKGQQALLEICFYFVHTLCMQEKQNICKKYGNLGHHYSLCVVSSISGY